MKFVRRAWISFATATVACLVIVPAAHAALGFQGLSASPADPTAGAHSDVSIHIGFTGATDNVKDLTVGLPPGLVGDPTATPLCTVTQLQGDSCPAASQVGTVTAQATVHLADPLPLTLPLTVNGSLYNVTAPTGEPARFGIVLRPIGSDPLPAFQKIIQISDVQLRKGDFGLNTVLTDIPKTAQALGGALSVPTDINSLDINLSGVVGGKGFMRNPTSCGTKTTTFTADSYANPTQKVTGQASYTSTNCAALPFSPSLSVSLGGPGATKPGQNLPMTATVQQGDGQAGLRGVRVLLAPNVGANISVLVNKCSLKQFRADSSKCPAASKVGSATAKSPYLPAPLTGPVVIVPAANGGFLPRLGLDLKGPLALQIFGNFVLDPSPGNSFTNLPDIPISQFSLRFHGGTGGLVSSSDNLCTAKPEIFQSAFIGWNDTGAGGNVPATTKGCG
ncbi:MAG: hypothetical protein ACRDK1_08930 [Solirubrobacterales bacterium]